jgi:hypothetical protein
MRRNMEPEPEHFVSCSERVILECECGERLVLLGLEEDWYSEGRTTFECECGRRITLADRVEEDASYVSDPIQGLRSTYYNL